MSQLLSGPVDGAGILEDRFNEFMRRTVGRWDICPFWALRGQMFGLAEKALIIALFDVWHTSGRPTWFYSSNQNLERLSGTSHRAFHLARRSLLKKCVIQTKPGKRGRPKVGAVIPSTAYSISQDFLKTLAKDREIPTLKTSTYSVGAEVALFPDFDRRINGY